jgi:hypothetical protein
MPLYIIVSEKPLSNRSKIGESLEEIPECVYKLSETSYLIYSKNDYIEMEKAIREGNSVANGNIFSIPLIPNSNDLLSQFLLCNENIPDRKKLESLLLRHHQDVLETLQEKTEED